MGLPAEIRRDLSSSKAVACTHVHDLLATANVRSGIIIGIGELRTTKAPAGCTQRTGIPRDFSEPPAEGCGAGMDGAAFLMLVATAVMLQDGQRLLLMLPSSPDVL